MKTSVLINCYNYESFVGEAIRSVAAQTRRPDELIVVDDGSTDGSVGEIEKALEEIGFGRLVRQENGGQLSAFQRGIAEAEGEWLFFLDADDLYEPEHISAVLEELEAHPEVDFLFTGVEEFGDGEAEAFRYRGPFGDLGYSVLLVLGGLRVAKVFVGGVTSTLCIRKSVLERLFPWSEALLRDWRIRADNVLVLGSSLAGARKYHLERPTVKYRVHGANHFAGVGKDRAKNAWNGLNAERLLGAILQKVPYQPEALRGIGVEYRGVPVKNAFLRKAYWKTVLTAPMSLLARLKAMGTMMKSDLSGDSGD